MRWERRVRERKLLGDIVGKSFIYYIVVFWFYFVKCCGNRNFLIGDWKVRFVFFLYDGRWIWGGMGKEVGSS